MASKFLWLLDNGHGGIIDGVYQTKGKRSPGFEDGTVLFEGEFNRSVVKRIAALCEENGVDFINLVDTEKDIPLSQRTREANEVHAIEGRCVYVSVHANAFQPGKDLEFNSANGIDSFYFEKDGRVSSSGKKLAEIFQKHLKAKTGRRDRGIKGRNFHVLRKTNMPAVLTENGFMTNREEARLLLSNEYRNQVAEAHFGAILEIEDRGSI